MPTYCRARRTASSYSSRQRGGASRRELLPASVLLTAKYLLWKLAELPTLAYTVHPHSRTTDFLTQTKHKAFMLSITDALLPLITRPLSPTINDHRIYYGADQIPVDVNQPKRERTCVTEVARYVVFHRSDKRSHKRPFTM